MKGKGGFLNTEQLEAVEHKKGPLLIVAGAGTGKTTVIIERIKWLLEKNLAKPEEILALTFTEKAASEMEERVDQALPYGTFGMWITTFHSFCDRILKSEALHIGLNPHFKLLSEAETHLLVKKNFWKFDLKNFRPSGNPYKFIDGMIQHFSRLKDEDISPDECKNDEYPELVAAYKTYEELKIQEGVMDFADLISHTLRLFRERKNILERYRKQFKYILVDEFQDTNLAQYELVKLLAADDSNLTVVGDDSQSIYKFRGAAISNILSFMKDYPKAKQIVLTKNYRSTQTILDAAYKLIKHNDPDTLEAKLGINKNLASQIGENGEEVGLIHTERLEEEAEEVIKKIKEIKDQGYGIKDRAEGKGGWEWKDFAILVRANNHSEPFVKALERARIPFQFLGPGMLFKQSEVKDLIAYLKVLYDFTDTVSLYRVLSMDIFDFAQRDLIWILNKAKKVNLSLFEQLEKEEDEKIKKFVAMVHRHQELVAKESAGQILYYFLQDSDLLAQIANYKTAAEERRALNISKFFDKLKTFESVHADASVFAVVDYLDLAMDMGESPKASETDWGANNAVNILTVHSAKGLEFPVVFLTNLVEGRFPTRERKEQIPVPNNLIKEILPSGDYHLQEERRLFYVGMTRAKDFLYLTAANFYGEGKRERKLSPFVYEALGDKGSKIWDKRPDEKQLPLFEWAKPAGSFNNSELKTNNPRVNYLSYSAIQAFRDCPLHYKLRYLIRLPTPTTAPLSMGNSVHLALRDFYKHGGDLLDHLKNNWIIEGYSNKKHEQESLTKAQKFLTEYLATDLHKKAKPIHLEETFTFPIDSTLKIGGKIDRIDELADGTIEVIDYKTGANVPTQKEIDNELQMTIYALAATIKKPVEKVRLCFYYFDTATKIETIRTKEQLEEAKKQLLAIRDEIQKSEFLCSHSMLCDNCEFKMLCG